jgi:ring-1,2-phenylacetyl-CoA epoxidase subunit PaaC
MSNDKLTAINELINKMADDQLILGHRNSEWTGIGPVLEEDIAFSSLAQDKVGQSYNLYNILHQNGLPEPDTYAFNRKPNEYKCSHLVQLPIGEYDFSLVRHFLYDHAEYLRFGMLTNSTFEPLRNMARKFRPEIKYHVFHANTWIKQLANSNDDAKLRIQTSLNFAMPYAFSMFEPGKYEALLIEEKIFEGEVALQAQWKDYVSELLESYGLNVPEVTDVTQHYGGRYGSHTEHLEPMIKEMQEVFSQDPSAEW